jgi:phage FluMu protein Com
MPLPKLNVPSHELTVPSSGDTILYRPFLVKEEKVLLMANEDDDANEMVRAMQQTINDCILEPNDYDVSSLPLFDIEYIFLNLRAKSINEISEVGFKCPECDTTNQVTIDLSEVEVVKEPEHSTHIKLTDDISLVMNYPKIDSMALQESEMENPETIFKILESCIADVIEGDEVHDPNDYTKEELGEFINSFTQAQFSEVQTFFETMPKLSHTVDYKCSKCNHTQNLLIEGLQNFFA